MVIDYRASGEVGGHLGWDPAAQALSDRRIRQGDLRVLSFTGETGWVLPADATSGAAPPSPATLTVLRESASDETLVTVSTLPNASVRRHSASPASRCTVCASLARAAIS